MKRYVLICLSLLWLPLLGWTQSSEPFQAGKDYQVISTQKTPSMIDGNVEVVEFFNYGCPGCFFVESAVKQWLLDAPESIHFQRTPVVLTPQWRSYARAYHAAQTLGMEEQLSPALFAAIHEQKRNLTSDQAIIAFFMEQGVTAEQIEQAFDQQQLKAKLSADIEKIRVYRANAIPGFGVAGQYRTDLAMAKNDPQRMMEIVDFLIMQSQQPPS
ncbi:MAG: thioredoxin domain-containing protein [Legionellales bacterium]|nr:thioredoxin domain-containing protein [Legionellales bacterium]